jgi:glutaconate CoA-transferase subunit B
MDFGGPDHAIRIASLHPGVTSDQVRQATGFPVEADDPPVSPLPDPHTLALIDRLDPHNLRSTVFKGNPMAMGART